MNNTLLAVIGGALLLGLVALGITSWGSGNANGASSPMSGAMGPMMQQGGMMGSMGPMMQGGSMGPSGNMGNMNGMGSGMGGMHGGMMGGGGMGQMQGGMMGEGGGHCAGMQTDAPITPEQPQDETQK